MTYIIKDIILTNEEFNELDSILGEHRRICREQNTSDYGKYRYELSESLIYKLVTEVRNKNIYTK